MTHSEIHRQFYLGAAGIRMWYAKRPLPGAAPSPEYPPDDDIVDQEPVYDRDASRGLPNGSWRQAATGPAVHRTVDLQSLMEPAANATEPSVSPGARPESSAATAVLPPVDGAQSESLTGVPEAAGKSGVQVSVEAHLGIWSTESYLLISQWSDEASERLQDSLAVNLLGVLRQADIAGRKMLRWPVFRNPNVPGSSLDDFREILSRVLSSYQNQSIILLGVLQGEQEDHRQHCLKSFLPRVGVDFSCSLAELSATADHKRDLWASLKSRYSL